MLAIIIFIGTYIGAMFGMLFGNNDAMTALYKLETEKEPSDLKHKLRGTIRVIICAMIALLMMLCLRSYYGYADFGELLLCFTIVYAAFHMPFDLWYNEVFGKVYPKNIWDLGGSADLDILWRKVSPKKPGLVAFIVEAICYIIAITILNLIYN